MNNRWLMIKQLDKQLKGWEAVSSRYGRPRFGWVKTLRQALNMTREQLATRLGVKRGRIAQLENAEIHDGVTLRALKEVAAAMDCEFVYALVPKKCSSLESIIKSRAEQIAEEKIATVAHTMMLEAQSVSATELESQKIELVKTLYENLNKKFWEQSSSESDFTIPLGKLKEQRKRGNKTKK